MGRWLFVDLHWVKSDSEGAQNALRSEENMSRFLKGTVAALALSAVIGLPSAMLAQTDSAPEVSASVAASDAIELPQVLQGLNLSDVQVRKERRGVQKLRGTLEDGTVIRAFIDGGGTVRGAFAGGGKALPDALIEALIPEEVRAQEITGQFSTISAAFNGERGIKVGGSDAEGERIRAVFTQDGTLMRFGRGEDMHGSERRGHDRRGKAADHHRHGKGDPRHWERSGKEHHRGHGPAGHHGAPLTDDAARGAVSGAGYTDLGAITHKGPRTLVEATNPQGDQVQVELNPRGEVIRETAR